MLLNDGSFKGSGGGMDSSPVGCGVSAVWVAAGELCGGLEQATKAPSRMKVTKLRTRLLPTSCTESRSPEFRNTEFRNKKFRSTEFCNIVRAIVGMTLSPPRSEEHTSELQSL